MCYYGFVLWITLLNRTLTERKYQFELFWSIKHWIANEPGGKEELIQYINNILLFIPFGFLLTYFYEKRWLTIIVIALCFSAFIEVAQYCFALGFAELDDVISNTVGAIIGSMLFCLAKKIIESREDRENE